MLLSPHRARGTPTVWPAPHVHGAGEGENTLDKDTHFPAFLLTAESTKEFRDLQTAVCCSDCCSFSWELLKTFLLEARLEPFVSRVALGWSKLQPQPARQSALLSPCSVTRFTSVPGVWKRTLLSVLSADKLFSCKNCQDRQSKP